MLDELKRCKDRGVPFVGINTSDELEIVNQVRDAGLCAAIAHDVVRGFVSVTKDSKSVLSAVLNGQEPAAYADPVEALASLERLPEDSMCILLGAHRHTDGRIVQAVCNLRDLYKSTGRMLVLLGPTLQYAAELQNDLILLEDERPGDDAREAKIKEITRSAELDLSEEDKRSAISATKGLPLFGVETNVALSVDKDNEGRRVFLVKSLWKKWEQTLNGTPGLRVYPPALMEDVGGMGQIKALAQLMKGAKNAIGLIVFIDEIEKAMPSGGKGSGDPTARTMFGTLLTFMQELGPNGMVLEGGPGTGKSLVATAVGSVLNVPTVQYDITGMKDSLVGASERNQREAHKVIKVFGGRVFWIATCNSAEELPPELLRRFPRGKYFVDTPDDNEVQAIKAVYLRKHPSVADDGYNFSGFTGAEIRTVVETADEFNCSLSEAAKWTIPYSVKEAGALEALRRKADGKMMSVSYDGLYRYEEKKAVTNGTRKMF